MNLLSPPDFVSGRISRFTTVRRALPQALSLICAVVAGLGPPREAAAQDQLPTQTVVVIRDYPLQSQADFSAHYQAEHPLATAEEAARQYLQHVATVRKVQHEEYSIVRRSLQQFGMETLFIEGIPINKLPEFEKNAKAWGARAADMDKLRKEAAGLQIALQTRAQEGKTDGDYNEQVEKLRAMQREVVDFGIQELGLGVSARLMTADDLSVTLAALDTAESLALHAPSKPIAAGDEAAQAKAQEREELLAKTVAEFLKQHDVAILVLSGDTDLRAELKALGLEVKYGAATVPSYPKSAGDAQSDGQTDGDGNSAASGVPLLLGTI